MHTGTAWCFTAVLVVLCLLLVRHLVTLFSIPPPTHAGGESRMARGTQHKRVACSPPAGNVAPPTSSWQHWQYQAIAACTYVSTNAPK